MNKISITNRVRVLENVVIHVKRSVPVSGGKILVHIGDEVSPWDILGEGQSTTGFRVFHLAQELKVSPKDVIKFLKRQVGHNIYSGELLAEKPGTWGFGKKTILAPVDGIVDFYDEHNGDLRLKLLPRLLKTASGVFGIVDKVDVTRGEVTLRTMASVVYGIFGSGKEREGVIKVLGNPGELVGTRHLTADFTGKIMVGGGLIMKEALEKARAIGVAGIISGGVNAEDYKATAGGEWFPVRKRWSDIGLTLIITEGYGAVPVGEDIFTILKRFDGKYALVDGNQAKIILPSFSENCMIDIRKVKLPMGTEVEPSSLQKTTELNIGLAVRIVSPTFLGVQGVVEAVDNTPTKLPSGINTFLVTVETKNQKLRVPFENLEVI